MSRSERFVSRVFLAALAVVALLGATPAGAAQTSWACIPNGAIEAPPNNSAGTGLVIVDIDDVANTMRVQVSFSGLTGTTTASHIHGPTAVAMTGTAGVMTTTPSFVGFPLGVQSGSMDNTLDLNAATTYNPSFVTAQGSLANARATMLNSIMTGRAYLNIHSTFAPGGEIRCFLVDRSTPAERTTWGRIRSTYR